MVQKNFVSGTIILDAWIIEGGGGELQQKNIADETHEILKQVPIRLHNIRAMISEK